MSKHTPGPWAIRQEKEGWCRIYAPKDYYVGGEIAHYVSNANANLIAAAPDMLEALQSLIACDFGANGWTETAEQAAIKARTAVLKATGEKK